MTDKQAVIERIITYGAMPKKVVPIGLEELLVKAKAEGMTEIEVLRTLKLLTETKRIEMPTAGHYRMREVG